ncbi:MAG: hypothetical protein JWL69_2237 [Phycisphaerales bacterium]|jgi:hypothetical protein|nr:hypothetical protein [Phycisphaerales bacterium]
MLFWRTSRAADDAHEPRADHPGILIFGAEQAVQAIEFHLIDENITSGVSPESQARTITRLGRSPNSLSIRRDFWAAMTNTQRLQWLLDESHTTVAFCSDGIAILLEVL